MSLETICITSDLLKAVEFAVSAELIYQKITDGGRKFGITGEVGEILACDALGLRLLKDPRSEGFDALDDRNRRVQIKSRRSERSDLPNIGGRVGSFSKHEFDYGLMVILNRNYELVGIYRAEADVLCEVIKRHKCSNPTLREFKKIGKIVFQKQK